MKLDILVFIFSCVFQCLALSPNKTAVYYRNSANGDLWRLAWGDEFDQMSPQIDRKKWKVVHQKYLCPGNGDEMASCNTKRIENVRLEYGKLVLGATRERYFRNNYTGARVISRPHFSYGRYEIRAALPVASFVSSLIFTWNEYQKAGEVAKIRLLFNVQDEDIGQAVRFVNTTVHIELLSVFINSYDTIDFGMFHIYGVEWNETGVRMFFDNRYTVWMKYQEQQTLSPYHQIYLQIGVGGFEWDPDIAKEFDFKWPCPAFVIDYVRVFEPVTRTPLEGSPIIDIIAAEQTAEEGAKLSKICYRARKLATTSLGNTQLTSTSILIPSLLSFVVIFLAISGYLIYRLKKVKKTVKKTDSNGAITSKSLRGGIFVDAEIYETIDYYKDLDNRKRAKENQET